MTTELGKPVRSRASREAHWECESFLFHEAELLDDNRVREWFGLLTDDLAYEMPIRMTRERQKGGGFSERAFHMLEDHGSMKTRVDRLDSEYAWAEDPPSRTRRFVTNVRVDEGERADEFEVRSNLLVYRGRYDAPAHQLISCERRDTLRRVDGALMLARRVVLLDQTTVATHNLAIFI